MIRLRGHLICPTEDDAALVRRLLPAHLALSRAEPGCLAFEVGDTDDPLTFEVIEAFRTRAEFDAHQTRTLASPWFAATRHLARAYRVEELPD